ncbi:MAG: hypothetical protein KBC95_04855 [Candidatus Peribacteraceae bacterium]|nr:hypothetical protein [Candidatus Peribacteraceae bacterium]
MITDPNWSLSSTDYADYQAMFTAFRIDPATALLALPNLDAVIDAITNGREGHWQDALEASMKERNAYARHAGAAERTVDPSWLPPPASAPFSLIRQAAELVPLMVVPPKPLKVAIADDQNIVLIMFGFLMKIWPGLTVQMIHQQAGSMVIIDPDTDIILLDEHMEGRSGTAVYGFYHSQKHPGVFASISTTGNQPKWAKRQYADKTTISGNRGSAEGFIRFMNDLIADALAR